MDDFDQVLAAIARQRNQWREAALGAESALRRCLEDSKDLLAGNAPDRAWVGENIKIANSALDKIDALEQK